MLDKAALGQRLRSFADARGLSAYQIAQRMTQPNRTVYAPTIYDWWRGRHRPSPRNLTRYAEIVEATVEELLGDEASALTPAEIEARITERALMMLREMLAAVATGESPAAAHAEAAGEELPLDLAEALERHSPRLRILLNQMAGGDFLSQPPEEQLRVVRQLFGSPLSDDGEPSP